MSLQISNLSKKTWVNSSFKFAIDFFYFIYMVGLFLFGYIHLQLVTRMSENIETNKLFVGNLHWHIRRQELKEYFSQWGEVEFATVAFDRESKRSRWFGFVTFVNADDATRAKAESNEQELNWRPIYVDFARARDEEASEGEAQELESDDQEEME